MQVSVEKTSELSRKMTVIVPEDEVQEKIAARLKSLAKEVKIDGFRPGKVPAHVVKKLYGDRVRGEITSDLIQSTYFEALQKQELKPAGYPHILPLEETEGFKYTAEFEVYPEISLDNVGSLEVARPTSVVEESDVDEMIEKLRLQKREWAVVERPSQLGDRAIISFSGSTDGENFTDGKVENYQVEIGAKQMIPGFEDNLVGLTAGESKSFQVPFPEQYGNEKLAGKMADFSVELVSIEGPVLPELNEEFIKAYGLENGTLEAFREDVRNNMQRELENALRAKLKNAVLDDLYEKVQILVPNTLVDQEVENMMQPYLETAKRQKMKLEDLKLPRDVFEAQAKRRVALGLILGEVIAKNNIKIDNNKVRETIEEMAKSYERPEDVVTWYYSDNKRLSEVQQMVLEEQTVEWLLSQAKVSEVAMKFSDVMNNNQQ